MSSRQFQLAQINIAQAKDDMESETMQAFVAQLDAINQLAEASPGFVWRLQDESGDATSIQAFDDPLLLVNMSVWEDISSLKNFVYKSAHVEVFIQRAAWFHKMVEAHQALWWVPQGHIPTVAEGKARLTALRENGPGPQAFTFARPFEMAAVEVE